MVYGKLSKRSSIYETLLYLTSKLPRFYKRHYTLQITTPDRTLKQLQFSIPGKVDAVPIHAGDLISVVYTVRGYVMQKLVAITNHTTGKNYILPSPIPSPTNLTGALSTIITGLLVGSYFCGVSLFLASAICVAGTLAYLKLTHTAQLSILPLETQGTIGRRLLADQRLWRQKCWIEQRIDELKHDSKTNRMLITQLENLKQKMLNLDPQLYATRLDRASSAVKLIEQQVQNNQRLIREYEYTLRMIEVEMDASWIAEQLPEGYDFSRRILQKLTELKTIEDQNQSLKFQIAAYDELPQFS